jgi:hypothetical protein
LAGRARNGSSAIENSFLPHFPERRNIRYVRRHVSRCRWAMTDSGKRSIKFLGERSGSQDVGGRSANGAEWQLRVSLVCHRPIYSVMSQYNNSMQVEINQKLSTLWYGGKFSPFRSFGVIGFYPLGKPMRLFGTHMA